MIPMQPMAENEENAANENRGSTSFPKIMEFLEERKYISNKFFSQYFLQIDE